MGFPIIVSPAISDAGTITGAATPSSMGVENLLKRQPTDICRFSSLSGMYFEIDIMVQVPVAYIALMYTNADADTQVRWQASNASPVTGDVEYDSGWIDHWPAESELTLWPRNHHFHNMIGDPQQFQYWRCSISKPTGYYQAGRLILGATVFEIVPPITPTYPVLWQPSAGAAKDGIEVGTVEEVRRTKSEGGQTFARARPRGRTLSVPLIGVPKTEAYEYADAIGRLRGSSREVLLIVNPDDTKYIHQQSAYGLLSEPVRQTVIGTDPPLWQVTLRIEEMT